MRLPERLWSIGRSCHRRGWRPLARIATGLNWLIHKCLLPSSAQVGAGLILEHHALGIVVHPQVTIGDHCRIYHHVTLASESAIGSATGIHIGNRVTIGAHSIVIARSNQNLTIGDGATVGAGSVVTHDIPPGEVWAGNPARPLH